MDGILGGVLSGSAIVVLAGAFLILVAVWASIQIVPQSEKYVVERFGRLQSVLGPGINMIVPVLDRVAHRVSVLERQLPTQTQDAITSDNVLVKVDTSIFYRVVDPARTVYRIREVDMAILTTVAGIVRSEIGSIELDEVQTNRAALIGRVRQHLESVVDDWGIEVTRAEMMQQLNAERARRARVTEAEGLKRAVELEADAELYAAEQAAKARRITAEAEAYATRQVADAIAENGLAAVQYNVALKQVEALGEMARGQGQQTLIVPAHAIDAFADAFRLIGGKARGS